MKITTKIIHEIVIFLFLEGFFIRLSQKKYFFIKLIPLHRSYKKGTIKKVKRDNTIFSLDISDYMQWHIWAN